MLSFSLLFYTTWQQMTTWQQRQQQQLDNNTNDCDDLTTRRRRGIDNIFYKRRRRVTKGGRIVMDWLCFIKFNFHGLGTCLVVRTLRGKSLMMHAFSFFGSVTIRRDIFLAGTTHMYLWSEDMMFGQHHPPFPPSLVHSKAATIHPSIHPSIHWCYQIM